MRTARYMHVLYSVRVRLLSMEADHTCCLSCSPYFTARAQVFSFGPTWTVRAHRIRRCVQHVSIASTPQRGVMWHVGDGNPLPHSQTLPPTEDDFCKLSTNIRQSLLVSDAVALGILLVIFFPEKPRSLEDPCSYAAFIRAQSR